MVGDLDGVNHAIVKATSRRWDETPAKSPFLFYNIEPPAGDSVVRHLLLSGLLLTAQSRRVIESTGGGFLMLSPEILRPSGMESSGNLILN